jgi:multidrug resistance efflux pump
MVASKVNPMSRQAEKSKSEETLPGSEKAAKAVNRGGLAVLLVVVLSLAWYMVADRFTPHTSQARVQGYVVGVAPKVSGLVTKVWVTNNQEVAEGQPLFQIDSSQYVIALEKARSDLGVARNQVAAGGAAVAVAQALLRSAEANEDKAQKDASRLKRLHDSDPGTISIRRLETSLASLDMAKAAVAQAKAGVQQAIESKGGQDNSNNAKLKAAESAVEKAQLDLSNTVVCASTKGIIADLRTEVGQFAGTGAPVLTLLSLNDVWISAEFTENNLGHMSPGMRVEILFDSIPGKIFKGEIRSVGVGVASGSGNPPGTLPTIQNNRDWLRQSQRFPVVVGFDPRQSDLLRGQLRIGGQATVIGYTEGHGILALFGKIYIRMMSIFTYAY